MVTCLAKHHCDTLFYDSLYDSFCSSHRETLLFYVVNFVARQWKKSKIKMQSQKPNIEFCEISLRCFLQRRKLHEGQFSHCSAPML